MNLQTPVHGEGHIYDQDGLKSIHNHEFMDDPVFQKAYQRGVRAAGTDYRWHWRVHVGLWAASCSSKLDGDFVECGVNRGFLSSAIMEYLKWDTLGKHFYLLDTFKGLDERFVSKEEKEGGVIEKSKHLLDTGFYVSGIDSVKANFSEWKNVTLIEGAIPDTLPQIQAERIAYLHLDINCAPPEIAAIEFLWERLVPGAFILLDDYAYQGYRPQKIAMDGFARRKRLKVLSLPSGQGLLIKPASSSGRPASQSALEALMPALSGLFGRFRTPAGDASKRAAQKYAAMASLDVCPVCGGIEFANQPILWKELIDSWGLSSYEVEYINQQQGFSCATCKNNLRSMTLAAAVTRAFNWPGSLENLCRNLPLIRQLSVVEINSAEHLTAVLQLLPGHTLRTFPEIDMQDMSFEDASIDVIIHSDTLEHIPNSKLALRECCRVLKPNGHLFYTVPVVVGRLTKKREGLPPSYHGAPGNENEDYKVQTEYGADFWCEILEAGFREARLVTLSFPASVAVHATK
jgi:hypothetical protein